MGCDNHELAGKSPSHDQGTSQGRRCPDVEALVFYRLFDGRCSVLAPCDVPLDRYRFRSVHNLHRFAGPISGEGRSQRFVSLDDRPHGLGYDVDRDRVG